MNDSKAVVCSRTYSTVESLDWQWRLTFILVNEIIALVGLVTNVSAAWTIVKTRQIRNQSIKLVFYLSISNVVFAVVGQTSLAALFYYAQEIDCLTMRILIFVLEIFTYSSTYLTAMLGFDRFMRIHFQTTYSGVYTRTRFRISLAVLYFLIFLQAGLGAVGRFLETSALIITLPINIVVFGVVAVLYGKSIQILRIHEKNVKTMFKNRRSANLTRLASLYITTDFLLSLPIVLALSVYYFLQRHGRSSIDQELKGKVFYASFLFFLCHCPINAVCFLLVNKKAKSKISVLFRKSKAKGMVDSECKHSGSCIDESSF